MNKRASRKNGKMGGRPIPETDMKINLPNIEFVILTPKQYTILLKRYGATILEQAVNILENWLKTSPEGEKYRGKNNYAHFRSDGWLINSIN